MTDKAEREREFILNLSVLLTRINSLEADLAKARERIEFLQGRRKRGCETIRLLQDGNDTARHLLKLAEDKAAQLDVDLLEAETKTIQVHKTACNLRVQRNTLDSKLTRAKECLAETLECMRANSLGWEAARKERNEARRWACKMLTERNEAHHLAHKLNVEKYKARDLTERFRDVSDRAIGLLAEIGEERNYA